MNLLKSLSYSAAVIVCLGMTAGCQQAKSAIKTQDPVPTTVGSTAPKTSTLSAWLAEAPVPSTVKCSVERDVAPQAVDRFNSISEKVASLYTAVYNEAHEAATAHAEGNVTADPVLAKVTENAHTTAANWKTAAQDAVISSYQSTRTAIETQTKEITNYTSALRTDESILSIENVKERASVLLEIGKDTMQLSRQLHAAGEGASAIRMHRISTTKGK